VRREVQNQNKVGFDRVRREVPYRIGVEVSMSLFRENKATGASGE
jgi:hypothetical protein